MKSNDGNSSGFFVQKSQEPKKSKRKKNWEFRIATIFVGPVDMKLRGEASDKTSERRCIRCRHLSVGGKNLWDYKRSVIFRKF